MTKKQIIIFVIILLSSLPRAINLFGFPYYENDEGTYMSQAWSLVRFGKLAPYTYWYDHAPAGWVVIALWTKLTGGFYTFGTAVNSGRVLMLLTHLIVSFCMFFIVKRITKKDSLGIAAVLLYTLSPLAIYYQRRVLLDNLMTGWLFLAIAILYKKKLLLHHIALSGVIFGVSILTKEYAILFAPGLWYLIISRCKQKMLTLGLFTFLFLSIVFIYPLFAFLSNELFLSPNRVSLVSALQFQINRGHGLPFWEAGSAFGMAMEDWLFKDPLLVYMSFGVIVITAILSLFVKPLRAFSLFAVLFLLFLIRGGLVYGFYILPLVAVICVLFALLLHAFLNRVQPTVQLVMNGVFMLFLFSFYMSFDTRYLYVNETVNQFKAVAYIKENLSPTTVIAIDNAIFVELHEPGFINNTVYPQAHWSSKIERDSAIRNKLLDNNWGNIDYIVLSHEMLKDMSSPQSLLRQAFSRSKKKIEFSEGSTAYRDISRLRSTNGDWFSLYEVGGRQNLGNVGTPVDKGVFITYNSSK